MAEAATGGTLYLPNKMADRLPAMVRNELSKLTAQRQEEFVEEFQRKSKSLPVSYIVWLLLGWHYAYLRNWGTQFLFWITLGGLGLWWIADAFRLPGMVRDYNKDRATEVIRNLKAITGS